MLVGISIAVIILWLISLELRFSIKTHIDFFSNDGFFALRFFGIKIFSGKLHFEQHGLKHSNIIIERKKKNIEVHLSNDRSDKQSIASYLAVPYFQNMLIGELSMTFEVGKSNDAFFTVMTSALARIVFGSAVAILRTRQRISTVQNFKVDFKKDIFELSAGGIFSITIADIIYSAITTWFNKPRSTRRKKNVTK